MSPNRQKVFRNLFWAMLGKIINIFCGLLVGIFVARYLGPGKFGLMNYIISYVTLFSVFATFGLDSIEIRELAKKNVIKEKIIGTAFVIRLILSIITIGFISVTLYLFESDFFTITLVLIYSISLIINSLNVIRNYFTSIILNEFVVKTEIVRTIIGTGIKLGLLIINAPLAWFIVAATFDFVLIGGGYIFSYRKKVGAIKDWSFDKHEAVILMKAAFPLLLSGTAIIIYQRIDQVMIRNMINNDALGFYSIAAKFTEFAIFIPNVIAQTVTPLLVQAHQNDMKEYKIKSQQFLNLMWWGAVFIALLISLFAYPIILILYGSTYSPAIVVLQIMAWRAVFDSFFAASGQLIIIENLQKYAVIRNIIGLIVCVGLNLILIPHFGIIGSAWTSIITMFFSGYISHLIIKPYRSIFRLQNESILYGWRSLFIFKNEKK